MTGRHPAPTHLIAGRLQRDTFLPMEGRPLVDVPGGSLLRAAAGFEAWCQETSTSGSREKPRLGLLSRVGSDYPGEWVAEIARRGWDTRGIRRLDEAVDLRFFEAVLPDWSIHHSNPMAHFARLGLPFPKHLLGYQPNPEPTRISDPPATESPRPTDLPEDFLEAHAAHICRMDYASALRLGTAFRQSGLTTITLDPQDACLQPADFEALRILVHGLTAFMPSEAQLRQLFWGKTSDLWEMAEALAGFGCEYILIRRGAHGQMLFDTVARKRWEVPAYPARVVDDSGARDALCGGFLFGYQRSYDPLQGALHGSIAASLAIEGYGALHALEATSGLAQRRLEAISVLVRQV
jgi:sugar/nucleoside kinase (ribokinase family)